MSKIIVDGNDIAILRLFAERAKILRADAPMFFGICERVALANMLRGYDDIKAAHIDTLHALEACAAKLKNAEVRNAKLRAMVARSVGLIKYSPGDV